MLVLEELQECGLFRVSLKVMKPSYEPRYLSRNSQGCIRAQIFENRVKSDSIRTYPNYKNITQRNVDTYIILANQILVIDSIF